MLTVRTPLFADGCAEFQIVAFHDPHHGSFEPLRVGFVEMFDVDTLVG